MQWDNDRSNDEFGRLRLMASLKYDGYRDFVAGVRFIESLASWLLQFEQHERDVAYEFVTRRMVYIGPGEMEKLVRQFYTNWVRPQLIRAVADELNIPSYLVRANAAALGRIEQLRRRTLFLGLSDGARVDYIRHQNVGIISNEQVVGSTQLDSEKWGDLLVNLQKDTRDDNAVFGSVYLVDDFIATGTTFFRVEAGSLKGKLVKFAKSVDQAEEALGKSIFVDGYSINVHHYVGTAAAIENLTARLDASQEALAKCGIGAAPRLTCGITLPAGLPLKADDPHDRGFLQLAEKYYDPAVETPSMKVGGTDNMKLGYGGCALPLILEHNTPNNSVPLLWAETDGDAGKSIPAMRPLFRRRQRHI